MHIADMVSILTTLRRLPRSHIAGGRIVRIGPNEVSFASPSAALDLFRTGKGFHKTEFYTVFLPDGRKDIFTEIREPLHAVKKRFAVPAYNIVSIQQHTDEIEAVMTKFLSRIDNFADPGQLALCDLGSWLHYLAFDVSCANFSFNSHLCPKTKSSDSGPICVRQDFWFLRRRQ